MPAPSDMGEDEVVVFVVKAQSDMSERDVIEYAIMHMAYYMVPRYVQFLDKLPRTVTGKIQRTTLKVAAAGDDVWDRKSAGIALRDLAD